MVQLKLKEILEKKKISRYRLQLLTNLNYPRINQLYKNTAKNISFEEIEILTYNKPILITHTGKFVNIIQFLNRKIFEKCYF